MAEDFEIEEGIHIAPPRVMVYGPPGVGKTTLIASSDTPLFADLEQGSFRVPVARNKKPIDTWEKLMVITTWVATANHKYKTYVVDTLDKAEQLLHDYLCRTNKDKNGKLSPASRLDEVGGGFGKGFDAAVEEARKFTALLEKMWQNGISYVLIAHAKLETVHNPSGSDYERYNLAIHKKLCGMFFAACDIVLFANAPVFVQKEGLHDGKRERASGGDVRYLYTRGSAAWMAKNRYGFPPRIDMSWETVVKGIETGNSPDKLRAEIAEKLAQLDNHDISEKVAVKLKEAGNNVALLITITGRLDATIAKMEEAAAAAAIVEQSQAAAAAQA